MSIEGGQTLHPLEAYVPGDISSAAFFLCAAAIFPESNLVIDGVSSESHSFGAARRADRHGQPHLDGACGGATWRAVGYGYAGSRRGQAGHDCGAQTALLIDELPVLAAIAPFTAGLEVRDAGELRVKESDRLSAVTQNLRAMGAQVEQTDDGWRIPGGQQLHGAEIESFGDHRIAMAFAIAALRAQGETLIRDPECVAISYPSFFADLERLLEG